MQFSLLIAYMITSSLGILAQEVFDSKNFTAPPSSTYIAASYVKYIEGAGARVVPIL